MLTYSTMTLNLFTFIDLYLVMQNPFYPAEKRIKKYYIFSFIIALAVSQINYSLSISQNEDVASLSFYIYLTIFCAVILTAIVTLIFILIRLRRPGTSPELRKHIQRRYVEYIVLFMLFQMPITYLVKPTLKYHPLFEEY